MNNNKYLKVREEGFFQKIKLFFMNLFNKNEPVVGLMVQNNEENKKSFVDEMRNLKDDEKLDILKLQEDYEGGIIKEEDMTDEQISKIQKLYVEQITKLRESYAKYRNEAEDLRKKLLKSN